MLTRRFIVALVVSAALLSAAFAQRATEIFIPIGESPGLSGKYSAIGKIVSYDATSRTLEVRDNDGGHTAKLTDDTEIWLDRSQIEETNSVGSPADLQQNRLCEIKHVYDGDTRKEEAEWIKIQIVDRSDAATTH